MTWWEAFKTASKITLCLFCGVAGFAIVNSLLGSVIGAYPAFLVTVFLVCIIGLTVMLKMA